MWASRMRFPSLASARRHLQASHAGVAPTKIGGHWFLDLADARGKIADWKWDYNHVRPHLALGYQTLIAKSWAATGRGKDGGRAALENAARSHFPPASTAARRCL